MLRRMNKMLPIFRECSSDCPLIIVAMLSLFYLRNQGITCTKKKPKVRTNISNEGKYVKVKR